MKKEELQKRITELEIQRDSYKSKDERLRTEFAKAFRWGRPQKQEYGYTMAGSNLEKWDWDTPTWEQIFVEVGKLKSLMDYRDFDGNLSELEHKLETLERKVFDPTA